MDEHFAFLEDSDDEQDEGAEQIETTEDELRGQPCVFAERDSAYSTDTQTPTNRNSIAITRPKRKSSKPRRYYNSDFTSDVDSGYDTVDTEGPHGP